MYGDAIIQRYLQQQKQQHRCVPFAPVSFFVVHDILLWLFF
jgi:hypothetical protein